MAGIDRRAFIQGTVGSAALGAAAIAGAPAARAGDVGPSTTQRVVHAGNHPLYSLRFFRAGMDQRWKAGAMTLQLERLLPITTGDGRKRLHEGAFAAIFDLVDGRHAGSGTYEVTSPDGTTFPLHLARMHHTRGHGTRYAAVINRWNLES